VLIKRERIPVLHILTIGFLPGFLKKFIYRTKGYKIAEGVKLSLGCVVIGKDVEIGKRSSIGFFTIIRANKIKIGRFVKIGAMSAIDTEHFSIDDDARINEQVYVGGTKSPDSALIMGKRTIIMQASYINPTKPIIIGDDSGIGGHCLLFTHGSWNSQLEGYPVKFAPITIGKKVWLPWRVFVMPGVSIGDGAVIGADSMINKDIPAHSLAAGSPAKILKENFPSPLTDGEKEKVLKDIFIEFTDHLKYHGFAVDQKNLAGGFDMIIKKHSIDALIQFRGNLSEATASSNENSILILNKENIKNSLGSKLSHSMIVSLFDNSRIGTSEVGEELMNFLSRFGVRFNRLD
jgi:acetyltransferase-like isoleucine patch superfamily enzyme